MPRLAPVINRVLPARSAIGKSSLGAGEGKLTS